MEESTGETYGPLKALCERAAEQAMPGRVLSVRAGLIVGPHDPTDRFTYWPHRVARGGEVLAPGPAERAVQFIDARDLAAWIIRMMEAHRTDLYNANGPRERFTRRICQKVSHTASAPRAGSGPGTSRNRNCVARHTSL